MPMTMSALGAAKTSAVVVVPAIPAVAAPRPKSAFVPVPAAPTTTATVLPVPVLDDVMTILPLAADATAPVSPDSAETAWFTFAMLVDSVIV
jgi:hypothetical protein